MAKATVLRCDICEVWDSADTHVRTVTVAGPKFDLCRAHRVELLITCGVDPGLALRYCQMVDIRVGVRGNFPVLRSAIGWTPESERADLSVLESAGSPEIGAESEFDPVDGERRESLLEDDAPDDTPAPRGDTAVVKPPRRRAASSA